MERQTNGHTMMALHYSLAMRNSDTWSHPLTLHIAIPNASIQGVEILQFTIHYFLELAYRQI